jgi:hypothetical protein
MFVTTDGARPAGTRWRVGTMAGEFSVREEGRDGRRRKKGHRSARTLRAMGLLGVAGAVWLCLASSAFAAGASVYADGLHLSTGALVDPDGRAWISDHNAGFCRVTDATSSGPGHIEHAQFPGDTRHGGPTCLGGLLPGAGPGPDAASGAVFYANPATDEKFAFIGDGSAPSAEVVRAKWNPDTHAFDFDGTVDMNADPERSTRSRPNSVSLGSDGFVYVGFQKSGTIQRFDPADDVPIAAVVGRTSDGRGSMAVAAGGLDEKGARTVYVVESAGLRELHLSATATPTTRASFDVGPDTISALAYDAGRNVLYAGTANGLTQADKGADRLHRFSTDAGGAAELGYATGFSMVGGLAVRPDGNVFVLDDEALLDPAEPMGTGLMYLVGLPVAHIASGPTGEPAGDPAFTNDPTPTFTVTGDSALECSLVEAGDEAEWEDCSSGTLTPADPLDERAYVFSTRASNEAGDGVPESRHFTVDTTAPDAPRIASPLAGSTVSGLPLFTFTGESFARFTCNLDDAPDNVDAYTSCASGPAFAFGSDGPHTLHIKAIDRAGNVSERSAATTFNVDVTAPTVAIASPTDGATTGSSPAFSFTASERGVSYRCRLDDQPFGPCGAPHGFAGVAPGTHAFQVRGTDAVGNVGPVATRSFRVAGTPTTPADPAGTPASGAGAAGGMPSQAGSGVASPRPAGSAAPRPAGSASDRRAAAVRASMAAIAKRLNGRDARALARRGQIAHVVRFPAAGKMTIKWRVSGKAAVIARGSLTRRSAGRATVTVRLTRAGRQLLRRAPRLAITASARFRPALGGRATTAHSTFTLTRR